MSSKKFDPIVLGWKNKEYTIPSNKVMEAIMRIEDVVTLPELHKMQQRGGAPLAKLSRAFASVIQFAGAKNVTEDEVYISMFDDSEDQEAAAMAIMGILQMMTPPASMMGNSPPPGKAAALTKKTKTSSGASSRRRGNSSSRAVT